MVQVELRASTSTLRFCNSANRSFASSGMNLTLPASSNIAAAMARQKSTSNPDQFPFSSALENPGNPVLTPQNTASLRILLLSFLVSERSYAKAAAATASAIAQPINRPVRKFSANSFGMLSLQRATSKHVVLSTAGTARSQLRLLADDHFGPDRNAIVQIDDIGIDQAETSRRHGRSDGLRRIGAVDAIDGGPEIKRARAQRIAGPAGHEARQIRLALDHFGRRYPVWPFLLAGDAQQPLPLKAIAANADSITDRAPIGLDHIKEPFGRMNNDRAGGLTSAIGHHLARKLRRQLFIGRVGNQSRLIALVNLRKRVRHRHGERCHEDDLNA